jgi:hypothetical protein
VETEKFGVPSLSKIRSGFSLLLRYLSEKFLFAA